MRCTSHEVHLPCGAPPVRCTSHAVHLPRGGTSHAVHRTSRARRRARQRQARRRQARRRCWDCARKAQWKPVPQQLLAMLRDAATPLQLPLLL